jgi:TPR repeat protein
MMTAFRHALLGGALALTIAPVAAPAQSLSWRDILSPDRVVQSLLQYGLMALRTQIDLKYSDLTVNLLSGRATITDLRLWPRPEWDRNADCEIRIDRLKIARATPDHPGRLRFTASAFGVGAPAFCLPPDMRPALMAVGLQTLSVPYVGFDIDYDIASAAAQIQANFAIDQVAAFDMNAEFSYLWFNGRDDMEQPDPVFELSAATLSFENAGGWTRMRGMMPPPFTDPQTAANSVAAALSGMLQGMNRGNAPDPQSADAATLTLAQTAFITSAATSWEKFVQQPRRLVLETGFAPEDSVYLDFAAYENDPKRVFNDLQPRFSLVPASARDTIPVELLRKALGENVANLGADDRLRVGTALVSGLGVPRNFSAGTALLVTLAREGDSRAALVLSEVLESRSPKNAYVWGMRAGAAGKNGATARLDRLETVLPMRAILQMQGEAAQGAVHPVEALASIAAIKAQARARLTGKGMSRNYGIALMWAMLAAATGDAEAADMLEEIDARLRQSDPEGIAAWEKVEAESSRLALNIWLSRDLPAAFGQSR